LVYDPENQLILLSEAGKLVEEYGYAADGTRLWKRIDQSSTNVQVWIGNIYEEKGGKVLFHVFAGGQQICTFEAGSFLDGGSDSSKVGYYYNEDNLNSSSALSSSGGSQQQVNVYYPFGRTQYTTSQPGTFQVSRQFTGQVKDDETGLYYYGSPGSYGRYYDPELGRFIQADTLIPDLSNPQSYNRYSYAMNSPLVYTDPTGHYGVSDWWRDTEAGAGIVGGWVGGAAHSAGQGIEHFFIGDTSYHWDPNSYNVLSGGTFGKEIPGVGNPVTAPIKAGAHALVQAGMMVTPAGDEEAAGLAAKELKTVAGKIKGSYVHEFESGMEYVGKGTKERMLQSGKQLENANNDKLIKSTFEPSKLNTDKQAFVDEAQKIENRGGVSNPNLYNKINSPGKKDLPLPPSSP
jgi:RHS repeat-associated protein